MPVLTNIILPWNGLHASIPAGWTRATNFDGKVKKSYGAEAVAVNGGNDIHTHASSAHTHSKTDTHSHDVAYNTVYPTSDDSGGTNKYPEPYPDHSHITSTITTSPDGAATSTIAYPSTALNNLPPFHEVIYLKASAGASLKQNHIVYTDVNSVPAGWQIPDGTNGYPDMRNRYLRGAAALGNAGTQGGSLTHTHDLSHSHTTTHSHTGVSGNSTNMRDMYSGGSGSHGRGQHTHTVTLNSQTVITDTYSGSVTSGTTEPTYYKLLTLINTGAGPWKKGMIAMFEDDASLIPVGWKICNGQQWTDKTRNTPDLRDKFIKIANDGTEIGNTGGSNTHSHAASNSHSHSKTGTHTHTGSTSYEGVFQTGNGPDRTPDDHQHTLASVSNNSANLTWGATTMAGEDVSNQPAYRTVYFIQLERLGGGSIMLNLV